MDINKHNEKIWDKYLDFDYGNYENGFSESDKDIMTIILFGINGVENKKVLDLGVGTGRTTEILLPQSKEYIGTDYSPNGITICKNKFPNGKFIVNDFTKGLPFLAILNTVLKTPLSHAKHLCAHHISFVIEIIHDGKKSFIFLSHNI